MSPGYNTSVNRLYRIGVSLLLTAHATGSLANKPLMDGLADGVVLSAYASNEPAQEVLVESGDHQSAEGEAVSPLKGVAQDAIATPPAVAPNPLGNQLVALGNDALDEIRGGFELPDTNLKFSFGIERAVFINGELVASTVLNVTNLQLVAGGGGGQVLPSAAADAVGVIQSGAGNSIAAQIGANMAGTVIQNSLNDQSIRTVTNINAVINSAHVLRAMSLQDAVQSGIVSSLQR